LWLPKGAIALSEDTVSLLSVNDFTYSFGPR
jgi:hypothetical protein